MLDCYQTHSYSRLICCCNAVAAYRHCLPEGSTPADAASHGFYLVTAAVDRMDMMRPLSDSATGIVPDLRLSGHVSYATESSLEVFVRLSALPAASSSEEPETILLGRFAMAARKLSGGKQIIPKLVVDGPEEAELWKMGKDGKERKFEQSRKGLDKIPPNEKEAKMMHDLFMGRAEIFGEF